MSWYCWLKIVDFFNSTYNSMWLSNILTIFRIEMLDIYFSLYPTLPIPNSPTPLYGLFHPCHLNLALNFSRISFSNKRIYYSISSFFSSKFDTTAIVHKRLLKVLMGNKCFRLKNWAAVFYSQKKKFIFYWLNASSELIPQQIHNEK